MKIFPGSEMLLVRHLRFSEDEKDVRELNKPRFNALEISGGGAVVVNGELQTKDVYMYELVAAPIASMYERFVGCRVVTDIKAKELQFKDDPDHPDVIQQCMVVPQENVLAVLKNETT